MDNDLSFQNAVSLVTGGASGLGRATAERLAAAGSRVALLDLPSSNGEEVAKEIGSDCVFTPADVSVLYLYILYKAKLLYKAL